VGGGRSWLKEWGDVPLKSRTVSQMQAAGRGLPPEFFEKHLWDVCFATSFMPAGTPPALQHYHTAGINKKEPLPGTASY